MLLMGDEDSGLIGQGRESELSFSFVNVIKPTATSSEKPYEPTDWYQEFEEVLTEISIPGDTKEWVLTSLYKWDSLERLKELEPCDSIDAITVQNKLAGAFASFCRERDKFFEHLISCGINREIISQSNVVFHFFRGADCIQSFLNSGEGETHFGCDGTEKIRQFFREAPSETLQLSQLAESGSEEVLASGGVELGDQPNTSASQTADNDEQNDSNKTLEVDHNGDDDVDVSSKLLRLNWKKELQDILTGHKIDQEATDWILDQFYRWDTLDSLENCDDLTPRKMKVLKAELHEFFERFIAEKNSFVGSLASLNVNSDSITSSRLFLFFAGGTDSMQQFLQSEEIRSHFNQDDITKLDATFLGLPYKPHSEILKDVENILKELNLDVEGMEEVMNKFVTFEDLQSGLALCEDITRKQRRLIAEKLQDIWKRFKNVEEQDPTSTEEALKTLGDLDLTPATLEWVNDWLEKNDSNCLDISEMDSCKSLEEDEKLELAKSKLATYYGLEQNSTSCDVEGEAKTPQQDFDNEMISILDANTDIKEAARLWILENIRCSNSVDDLEKCDELTGKQIVHLKNAFADLFLKNIKTETRSSIAPASGRLEKTAADMESAEQKDTESGNCDNSLHKPQLGMSLNQEVEKLSLNEELQRASGELETSVSIIPLILCRTELEEGFSVDKFSLSEEAVNHICQSVPPELTGEMPVMYQSVSNGTVIDFPVLDELFITCLGIFGPFQPTIDCLQNSVPLDAAKISEIEDYFAKTQACGIYLIDLSTSQKKFIVFFSEKEDDFERVKKDSRAVQLLRFMTQLTNDVVVCIDDSYSDRLSVITEKDLVKSDRCCDYDLEKKEVQHESCLLKPLGSRQNPLPTGSQFFASENSLTAVTTSKTDEKSNLLTQTKYGDVNSIKTVLNKLNVPDSKKICDEFKTDYINMIYPEVFAKLEKEVNDEIKQMGDHTKKAAHDLVIFSIAMDLVYKTRDTTYKVLKKYYTHNGDDTDFIWARSFTVKKFDCTSKQNERLNDAFMKKTESGQSIEKYLLWESLDKASYLSEEARLSYSETTWKELRELAEKCFGSRIPGVTQLYVKKQKQETVDEIDFHQPPALLVNSISEFTAHVFSIVEKVLGENQKFLAFCRNHEMTSCELEKNTKLEKRTQEVFDNMFKHKQIDEDDAVASEHPVCRNTIGVLTLIEMVEKRRHGCDYNCIYTKLENSPAKNRFSFHQAGLTRRESQRLMIEAEKLNVEALEFLSQSEITINENEELFSILPIGKSNLLLIFNLADSARAVTYNSANMSKELVSIPFGHRVVASSFDSKGRVLALSLCNDANVVSFIRFTEHYTSRDNLSPIELQQLFLIEDTDQVKFVIQPNSTFMWVLIRRVLRKIDYRQKKMVGKAIKCDGDGDIDKLMCSPDGNCLLLIDLEGTAMPVMTATGNTMEPIENLGADIKMFILSNRLLVLKLEGIELVFYQLVLTGAQHETKLNKFSKHDKVGQRTPKESDQIQLHWLNFIYWMFTKFPCNDLLSLNQSKLNIWIKLQENSSLMSKVASEVKSILNKLQLTKKPLDCLKIHTEKANLPPRHICPEKLQLGKFLKRLIAFVPTQLARCQSGQFNILENGKPIPLDTIGTAFDLKEKVNIGFYESIFNNWRGDVKVISSMGKQTTGKSYTLNHLTGSSFNIAGTRCTDGCWMTVKEQEDCLYVILDFEGLGSIERNEQDDMLLSLFNSSISTVTLFKTEKRLDREVDKMFNKINLGSGQMKGTDKIFKGRFGIVINDVAEHDIAETPIEFEEKISNIVARSDNNFIKNLYDGKFSIFVFPAFESADYYNETSNLLSKIRDDTSALFTNGHEFIETLKLIMAKLATLDFSPLDRQQIDERIQFLRSILPFASRYGQMSDDMPKRNELQLNSLDDVTFKIALNKDIHVDSVGTIRLNDFQTTFNENHLQEFVESFLNILTITSENFLTWRTGLEQFVSESIDFRFERVKKWMDANLQKWKNCRNQDYDEIISVVMDSLEIMKLNYHQTYKFCEEKCKDCFLKCTHIVNHKFADHECSTNHNCSSNCEFCDQDGRTNSCKLSFGHSGSHLCAEVNHVCGQLCFFSALNGCKGECQKFTGHADVHICAQKRHPCKEICSLYNCGGRCVIDCDDAHAVHKCTKEECIERCSIETCTNKCSAQDHFHGSPLSHKYNEERDQPDERPFLLSDGYSRHYTQEHFCGKEHQCDHDCQHEGFCQVSTEKQLKEETFEGKRDTFTYNLFVEKGKKLKCLNRLKPFEKSHSGSHSCSTEIHFCETMCPTCENICCKPVNHEIDGDPLHHARHGNMRKCFFVANEDDIEVGGHKYKVGEPAVAEMCHIFCNTMGRGHVHVLECEQTNGGKCEYLKTKSGRKHQSTTYHPNPNIPKDEMTHEAYWASIGFQDPCKDNESEDFEKCSAYCPDDSHDIEVDLTYCELPIWHEPVKSLEDLSRSTGFVSKDGHVFPCDHPLGVYHFVFCLDSSHSITNSWNDVVTAVQSFIRRRRQMATQDMITVELYTDTTEVVAEYQTIHDFDISSMKFMGGKTNFDRALSVANQLIGRHLKNGFVPVLIFMSDGQCGNGELEMEKIAQNYRLQHNLKVYTLGFGKINFTKLKELARVGHGDHLDAQNEKELREKFVDISAKHPPAIGVSYGKTT